MTVPRRFALAMALAVLAGGASLSGCGDASAKRAFVPLDARDRLEFADDVLPEDVTVLRVAGDGHGELASFGRICPETRSDAITGTCAFDLVWLGGETLSDRNYAHATSQTITGHTLAAAPSFSGPFPDLIVDGEPCRHVARRFGDSPVVAGYENSGVVATLTSRTAPLALGSPVALPTSAWTSNEFLSDGAIAGLRSPSNHASSARRLVTGTVRLGPGAAGLARVVYDARPGAPSRAIVVVAAGPGSRRRLYAGNGTLRLAKTQHAGFPDLVSLVSAEPPLLLRFDGSTYVPAPCQTVTTLL